MPELNFQISGATQLLKNKQKYTAKYVMMILNWVLGIYLL